MLVTMKKVFMNVGDITYVKPLSKIYMLQALFSVYQKPVPVLVLNHLAPELSALRACKGPGI
jgi:hypothetical protein